MSATIQQHHTQFQYTYSGEEAFQSILWLVHFPGIWLHPRTLAGRIERRSVKHTPRLSFPPSRPLSCLLTDRPLPSSPKRSIISNAILADTDQTRWPLLAFLSVDLQTNARLFRLTNEWNCYRSCFLYYTTTLDEAGKEIQKSSPQAGSPFSLPGVILAPGGQLRF